MEGLWSLTEGIRYSRHASRSRQRYTNESDVNPSPASHPSAGSPLACGSSDIPRSEHTWSGLSLRGEPFTAHLRHVSPADSLFSHSVLLMEGVFHAIWGNPGYVPQWHSPYPLPLVTITSILNPNLCLAGHDETMSFVLPNRRIKRLFWGLTSFGTTFGRRTQINAHKGAHFTTEMGQKDRSEPMLDRLFHGFQVQRSRSIPQM